MAREVEQSRLMEIAAALNGRVRNGEELLIRRGEDGVEVLHAEETPIRKAHPDLYGKLVAANEQIASAGTSILWILGLIGLGLCVSIHREWIDHVGPLTVAKAQSFWTYLMIMVGSFIVSMYVTELFEARVYENWKKTLVDGMQAAGLERFLLLSQAEGHVELASVARKIKRDTRFEMLD